MNIVVFCKTLGDITRFRIVRLVMDDALCICELSDILEMPQSSVSSHVQVLRKAGLLESEKCEKWTYFRIENKYLKLLRSIYDFFPDAGGDIWCDDASKVHLRLKLRENSCCPGPRKLASRHNGNPNATSAR